MIDPVANTPARRAPASLPQGGAILVLLVLSAMAVLLSPPLLMPASYSWVSHSVSESAAQGLPGAWLTRTGFLLWGSGVLWLASLARETWGRWGSLSLGAWGTLMIAAAAYSHAPWQGGVPSDSFEDLLHSAAASGMARP